MSTVSFRVPDETKRRMDEAGLNWSELLRDAVEDQLMRQRRHKARRAMDRTRKEIYDRTGRHATASQEVLSWRRLH